MIFAAFLRQNFSRQTYGRVSSFEVAPLPSFASSDAVNRLRLDERGDKLCLSMLPPRLVARLDTTSSSRRSATPPENAYLKNFGVGISSRRAYRRLYLSNNTDAFKIPLRQACRNDCVIVDCTSGKKSAQTRSASLCPCTGVRDKDGRAYAPKRFNIIYMMSNACLETIFRAKSAENKCFFAPRRQFFVFSQKQG